MHDSHGADVSPICVNCISDLDGTARAADEFVSSSSRLCFALADCASYEYHHHLRTLAVRVSDVLFEALNTRASFFNEFDNNQCSDIIEYNSTHRNGSGMSQSKWTDFLSEASKTGELFPGRPQVRPNIDFGATSKAENAASCRKNYSKANSHTPGIFTVQCVCSRPKLLGVSVMTKTEGVSTALSTILSRFKVLHTVCYYDNGCNMARSITLRVPWVNEECLLVCDRFHYSGHTCNSICDPDSYTSCNGHATSGAESINQLWTFSKSHLRFLKPENLMPFIAARAIFLNVRANIRESSGKCDISSQMLVNFVKDRCSCTCDRCNEEIND